jgi:CheY-like chemotaxis protein
VLFMSAYADSRLDAALAIPFAELITKPFSMDELGSMVQRSLVPAKRLAPALQSALG